ncbi:MAG: ABC transporter permease [Campylobacter sp.]|nr:ABC transporter permease [Campylobacter sp.]
MRLAALIKKEALAILHSRIMMIIVCAVPFVQIFVFSYAASMEVKNVHLGVLNLDGSEASKQIIRNIETSSYLSELRIVKSYEEGKNLMVRDEILGFLAIPQNYSRGGNIALFLNGRHSNSAQLVSGYISQSAIATSSNGSGALHSSASYSGGGVASGISSYKSASQADLQTNGYALPSSEPNTNTNLQTNSNSAMDNDSAHQNSAGKTIVTRVLFNPNLDNFNWIVPNLFCLIVVFMAIILTAMSVVRERENGTLEQILVSPLSVNDIMLGKLIPALIVSIFQSVIILTIAKFFFLVPVVGSMWLLYLGLIVFSFCICGIGLLISVFSKTQQQALLWAFVFLLPSVVLSGFSTPVTNMPGWLQYASKLIPLSYQIDLIRAIFLKDISFIQAMQKIIPLFVFGMISITLAQLFFRKMVLK